jgi:hypothetical protein
VVDKFGCVLHNTVVITYLPDPRVSLGHRLAGVFIFGCSVALLFSGPRPPSEDIFAIWLPLLALVVVAGALCSLGLRTGLASLLGLVVVIFVFALRLGINNSTSVIWISLLVAGSLYLGLSAREFLKSTCYRESARRFRRQLLSVTSEKFISLEGAFRETPVILLRQCYLPFPTSPDLFPLLDSDETDNDTGMEPSGSHQEWTCHKCHEEVDEPLTACWNCQAPRDSETGSPDDLASNSDVWQEKLARGGLATGSVQGSHFISSALTMVAAFIVWTLHNHPMLTFKDILIGSLVSSFIGGLASFAPSRLVQRSRDDVADAIRQGLLAGDPAVREQSYALYVRPFAVTRKFFEEPLQKPYVPPVLPAYYGRRNAELEEIVSDVTWPLAIPLIALGKPGEAFGAGRLKSSNKDWKEDAAALIEGSDFLFVVPSNREGTMWELQQIMEKKILHHCIFLMPWQVGHPYGSQDWHETMAACAEIGLLLPPWTAQGALFLTDRHGGWLVQEHLQELVHKPGMLEISVLELMRRSLEGEAVLA